MTIHLEALKNLGDYQSSKKIVILIDTLLEGKLELEIPTLELNLRNMVQTPLGSANWSKNNRLQLVEKKGAVNHPMKA